MNNYYLLDDMERYDKTFNRKAYEHLSEEDLIPIFKDYYDKHMPVDVTTWIRTHRPDENLIYKEGLGKQVCFIRDDITANLFYSIIHGKEYDHDKYESLCPLVIGTHRSKSVLLPVMQINLDKFGIKMIVRNNFYDWKLSVISDKDIKCDFKNIFKEKDKKPISSVYCEGFPKELVFGRYCDNKKQFTVELDCNYHMYVFMYLLRDYLINSK
jgi:hypothetical protein